MAFISLMLGMAIVVRASSDPDGEPVSRTLIEAERAFASDGTRLGTAAAFLAWSEPDAQILTARGTAPVRQVFVSAKRRDGDSRLTWWPTWVTLSRDGSIGVSSGPFEQDGRRAGYYLTLWRRQADGNWRWFFDGGVPADARSAPGADVSPRFVPSTAGEDTPVAVAAAELLAAETAFAARARVDQGAAHLIVVSAGARIVAASLPPMEGGDSLASRLSALGSELRFGSPDHLEIAPDGNLGWTRGPVENDDGQSGSYLRVWRKEGEDWRVVYEQIG